MTKRFYASLKSIKKTLSLLAFDPRNDLVHGWTQQAGLSPEYHRDRAIVLIRGLEPNSTFSERVRTFKLIFVHLMWWSMESPCIMINPKSEGPDASAP